MSFEASPGDPLYVYLIWFAIVIGVGVLAKMLLDLKQAILSESWPSRDAVLKEIQIDHRSSGEDGEEFRPKVIYTYQIGSKSYSSSRVSYRHQWQTDYSAAGKPFAGLVVGSRLSVYVNPDRPKQSVVVPGADYTCYVQIGLAVLFLGFAINGLMKHLAI